jgi:hypothetical protein
MPVHVEVERERAAEARAFEIAPAPAIAQQRLILLQRQREQRFELVERQQHRVTPRTARCLIASSARDHSPRMTAAAQQKARLRQRIATIEQQTRVHVPWHLQHAIHAVRVRMPLK